MAYEVAYLVQTYDISPTLVVNMNEIDIHIFLKSYYAFVEKKMLLDSEIHLSWVHIIDENYIASIYMGM